MIDTLVYLQVCSIHQPSPRFESPATPKPFCFSKTMYPHLTHFSFGLHPTHWLMCPLVWLDGLLFTFPSAMPSLSHTSLKTSFWFLSKRKRSLPSLCHQIFIPTCQLGTMHDAGDRMVNKIGRVPAHLTWTFWWGK